MASFAGEGEKALMAAVGTLETREAGGEVATAEEGFDGGVEQAVLLCPSF